MGVVRHVSGPADMAGDAQTQIQHPERQPTRPQLRIDLLGLVAGSRRRLSIRAESVHPGHLQLAADVEASPRSGSRPIYFTGECVLAAGWAGAYPPDPRAR